MDGTQIEAAQSALLNKTQQSSSGFFIPINDVLIPTIVIVSVAVLLAVIIVIYSNWCRRKSPENDSLAPSIVVYPSYQGAAPQMLSKDIAFSLPQLRGSESLEDLVQEDPVEDVDESDCANQLGGRSQAHRSNSFSGYSLGMIDPTLYQGALQFEEEPDFPEGHLGRIWFSLRYEASSEKLLVSLLKVKNLPSRSVGTANGCDPIVRLCLMPNGRRYQQSRQKKKTCNPFYDEIFVFQVNPKELEDHILKMSVIDTGRGKRRQVIGHITFPLGQLSAQFKTGDLTHHRIDLEKETQECISELGELLVSLLYNENQHRLTVSVIEARNIKFPDERQDSFVRVTLNQHYRTIKVKRTTTVRGSMEPKFTQGFHFNLTSANIDVTSVSLQLFQPGPGYSKGDKIIGKCVLGSYMFARGKALTHWNTALASPMEQVQQWHTLAE
ncbi:synaptotagmin-15 [Nilaparvata lugens]|uniref:synaptotagmin-15 n=1 Tax=Nilaparvata lugens TaxID=108931 RepID=UPI00193DAF3D|nr:synaptotagmin-15 [Nilaparvata lugens]